MVSVTGCCGESPLIVGWKKPASTLPFMRAIGSMTAAPPLPPLEPAAGSVETAAGKRMPSADWAARHEFAPCGVRMVRVSGFCSSCYDAMELGVPLSDGEVLCVVCAGQTFDEAEQYRSDVPPRPRVALLADVDPATHHLLADHLDGVVAGRPLELLLSLRVGDRLRCCGCIRHPHVGRRIGTFLGFCLRRRQALVQLDASFIACVPMELLRPLDDESSHAHVEMLTALRGVGTRATLQRAARTLCGSEALADAEAALSRLAALQEEQAHEAFEGSLSRQSTRSNLVTQPAFLVDPEPPAVADEPSALGEPWDDEPCCRRGGG